MTASILSHIGKTPLVQTAHYRRDGVSIFLKLEFMNPGGSVKDRIALSMIEGAEARGVLRPGMTLVEATAGNTGIGLALVAQAKGFKLHVVIPDKMSREKIEILRATGATVEITRSDVGPTDPAYYSVRAREIASRDPTRYFYVNQFENPDNPAAHAQTTGPELFSALSGRVDGIVAGVGTGGTITGCARYFRSQGIRPDVVLADPKGSILAEVVGRRPPSPPSSYLVEGIGEDYVPKTFDPSLVTHAYTVTDQESFQTARDLYRNEGVCVGTSSGTIFAAALRHIDETGFRGNLVAIMCDSGRNYLGKLFNSEYLRTHFPRGDWDEH